MRLSLCRWLWIAALLAAGCQPVPQLPLMSPLEVAGRYGFSDKEIAPGRFEVTYLTPARPTGFDEAKREEDATRARSLAHDLALWRAAELTASRSASAFELVDSRHDVKFDSREQSHYPPYYASPYPPFYPPLVDARRRTIYPYAYDDVPVLYRSTWLQARTTLIVELKPAVRPGLYDAKATAEQMRAKYSSAYDGQRAP